MACSSLHPQFACLVVSQLSLQVRSLTTRVACALKGAQPHQSHNKIALKKKAKNVKREKKNKKMRVVHAQMLELQNMQKKKYLGVLAL